MNLSGVMAFIMRYFTEFRFESQLRQKNEVGYIMAAKEL